MANDFTTDPFTQIHDKLWQILEANSDFTTTVKPGNRIKYSGTNEKPRKEERMHADSPEVTIVPQGGAIDYHLSSSSVQIRRTFQLIIQTSSLRANVQLYPLEWLIIKILFNASDTQNLSFIKKFRVVDAALSRDELETQAGRREWSSSLTIEVDAVIPQSDLTIS